MATHFRFVRIAFLCLLPIAALVAQTPVYLDPSAPVDQRVDDLIGRMTLDEKIGQMMQVHHPAVLYNLSDVYFYRLQVRLPDFAVGGDSKSGAGEFIQTRKLLLLK